MTGALIIAILVLAGAHPVSGQATEQPDLRRAISAYDAGELQRALDILQATNPSNVHDSAVRHIYLGLVYFALGDRARAEDMFGRAVRIEPPIRLDPTLHSPSRVETFDEARTAVLLEWRSAAREAETRIDATNAIRNWKNVLAAMPEDEEAAARVQALEEAERQKAAAEQARADSVAAGDSARQPAEEEPSPPSNLRYNPGQALAMGLVVPGLGQFYTGRSLRGALTVAAAGGVLAAGLLTEKLKVDCRSEPVNNVCPPEDILDQDTERPYMTAAVAAAAGITLISAIDAMLSARRANAQQAGPAGNDDGMRLLAPAVTTDGKEVRAEILRLRFR